MDEFDVEDMLAEFREELMADVRQEITTSTFTIAVCLVNAINAQPSLDNLQFTRDLISHLDNFSNNESFSGIVAGGLRETLQSSLDKALGGLASGPAA